MYRIKTILSLAAAAALVAACAQPSPQDRLTANDKKIDAVIAQMTL